MYICTWRMYRLQVVSTRFISPLNTTTTTTTTNNNNNNNFIMASAQSARGTSCLSGEAWAAGAAEAKKKSAANDLLATLHELGIEGATAAAAAGAGKGEEKESAAAALLRQKEEARRAG